MSTRFGPVSPSSPPGGAAPRFLANGYAVPGGLSTPDDDGGHGPNRTSPGRNGLPSRESPQRPTRSRMRDISSGSGPTSPIVIPPRRHLPNLQTTNLGKLGTTSGQRMIPSPTSPISAADERPPANEIFLDPFAQDRTQRHQLRAQTSEVAAHAARPIPRDANGQPSDRLRTAVGAFMRAGKENDTAVRRPVKSAARSRRDPAVDFAAGPRLGKLDSVLDQIRQEWPHVVQSDFSPSSLALSLLSRQQARSPSVSSFLRLHDELSIALQAAVQAHFQSFAASLPAHSSFLSTLGRAQQQVSVSRDGLEKARDGFAGRGKSELSGIRLRERTVRDILQSLDAV